MKLLASVIDRRRATQDPQGVLKAYVLKEQVMLLEVTGGDVWALKVEREPLLDPASARARGEVEEEGEVEDDGCREDRVSAQEVDLDLHGVAHPAEDIDVVPALLSVTAGGIIVNADLVIEVLIELRVDLWLEDGVEDT